MQAPQVSPPVRGAWIEICFQGIECGILTSPPVRGAWIEILIIAQIALSLTGRLP